MRVNEEAKEFEKQALAMQQPLEKTALQLYPVDKTAALEMLSKHSSRLYLSALEAMGKVLSER